MPQRIRLVSRARRELRVEARERRSHESGLLLLEPLQQDRVALGEPSVLELIALRQRHREQVRKARERLARRLRRRQAALRERLPAAARADPPLRGLLGHPFEQLLARAPLLRRLDLHALAGQSDLDDERRARRRHTVAGDDRRTGGGAAAATRRRAGDGAHATADRSEPGDGNATGRRRGPDGCGAGRGHDGLCARLGRLGHLGGADDLALAAQLAAHRCEGEWAAKILADRVLQQRAALVVEPVPPLGERDELGEGTDASAHHRRDALEVRGLGRRQGGVQLARLGLALGQRGEVGVLAVDERHDAVERAQRVIACCLPRRPPRAIGLCPIDRGDERIEGLQRAEPGRIGRARQRARLVEDGQAQLVEVGGRAPQVVRAVSRCRRSSRRALIGVMSAAGQV